MSKVRRYGFDEDDALEFGTDAAILMASLRFWIDKNRSADDLSHFHDGHWWTYNTIQGLAKSFPFWSPPQIRRIVERLKTAGVLLIGNFNKTAYDRTAWYAFADEASQLPGADNRNQKRHMHLTKSANGHDKSGNSQVTKSANGDAEIGKPIPVSATVSDQLVPQVDKDKPTDVGEDFESFWMSYPARHGKKVDKAKAESVWSRLSAEKRQLALASVTNYLEACKYGLTLAKDAHRWLRDQSWRDWSEPPVIPPNWSGRSTVMSPRSPRSNNDVFAQVMADEGLEFDPQSGRVKESTR